MKDYQKPEAEVVEFIAEPITTGVEDTSIDGDNAGII